jgi:hypothetical protein
MNSKEEQLQHRLGLLRLAETVGNHGDGPFRDWGKAGTPRVLPKYWSNDSFDDKSLNRLSLMLNPPGHPSSRHRPSSSERNW